MAQRRFISKLHKHLSRIQWIAATSVTAIIIIGGAAIVMGNYRTQHVAANDTDSVVPSNQQSGSSSTIPVVGSSASAGQPSETAPLTSLSISDAATIDNTLSDLSDFSSGMTPLDFAVSTVSEEQSLLAEDIQSVSAINLSQYSTSTSANITQLQQDIAAADSAYNNAFSGYPNDRLDELQYINKGNTPYNSAVQLYNALK